jgi:hypothetical protein
MVESLGGLLVEDRVPRLLELDLVPVSDGIVAARGIDLRHALERVRLHHRCVKIGADRHRAIEIRPSVL